MRGGIQYTKYGNSFSSTDIVKMIEEQTFEEVEITNKFVKGVYSKANVFARLSKEEDYQRLEKLTECHLDVTCYLMDIIALFCCIQLKFSRRTSAFSRNFLFWLPLIMRKPFFHSTFLPRKVFQPVVQLVVQTLVQVYIPTA